MPVVFLTGALKDKDTATTASILSSAGKEFGVVTPDSHRAMPAEELAALFESHGCHVEVCDDLTAGIERAMEKATEKGVVCCVGSLYLAGDVRRYFMENR
jgi:dihydrofolate synthase/folylpolyglutamate synthase